MVNEKNKCYSYSWISKLETTISWMNIFQSMNKQAGKVDLLMTEDGKYFQMKKASRWGKKCGFSIKLICYWQKTNQSLISFTILCTSSSFLYDDFV